MKALALALLLAYGGSGVTAQFDSRGWGWLWNSGHDAEDCWVQFNDGYVDSFYIRPNSRSRMYKVENVNSWGCY